MKVIIWEKDEMISYVKIQKMMGLNWIGGLIAQAGISAPIKSSVWH